MFEDKKIVIYGTGRFKEDFQYLFDSLPVEYCVDEDCNKKDVFAVDYLKKEELSKLMVIICKYKPEFAAENLQKLGLEYNKNYIFAEDMFKYLSTSLECLKNKDKKAIIWGTGKCSSDFVSSFPYNIEFFIDNNEQKKGNLFCEKLIKCPSEIENWHDFLVIVASSYHEEISQQLESLGLKEGNDFVRSFGLEENMARKVIYSKPIEDKFCDVPFDFTQVTESGQVKLCCWGLFIPAGFLHKNSFLEIWNSNIAKIIRLSIINKTFCFCNTWGCPVLNKKSSDNNYDMEYFIKENDYTKKQYEYPKRMNIAIDKTCNLKCISCRPDMYITKDNIRKKIEKYADILLEQAIPNLKMAILSGNGDVFFSPTYRRILLDDRTTKVDILVVLTNGILFNEKNWNMINGRFKSIHLRVSIDAASEDTYGKIRLGGSFKTLIKNMEFASELRKLGKINYFQINFLLQSSNCHEMSDFIKLGKKLNVDSVLISRITNWGFYSDEEFDKLTIIDSNENIKDEYKKYFEDEILKDKIVSFFNI